MTPWETRILLMKWKHEFQRSFCWFLIICLTSVRDMLPTSELVGPMTAKDETPCLSDGGTSFKFFFPNFGDTLTKSSFLEYSLIKLNASSTMASDSTDMTGAKPKCSCRSYTVAHA